MFREQDVMAAWGLQIWRHSTEVSGWYVSPAPLPSGKKPWGPLDRMFGVAQSCCGCGDQECLSVVCFLLGNSPASEFYMLTFRNTICSIFIGNKFNNYPELPRRKHTTYRTRRKSEIKKECLSFGEGTPWACC
jgi:hypothetical protein